MKHKFSGLWKNDQTEYVNHGAKSCWVPAYGELFDTSIGSLINVVLLEMLGKRKQLSWQKEHILC